MREISPKTLEQIYFRYRKDSPYATHFRGFKSQLSQDIIEANGRNGNLKLDLPSTVKSFKKDTVILNVAESEEKIKNDGIIVCAGGILPTPFLKQIGIEVETKHGQV